MVILEIICLSEKVRILVPGEKVKSNLQGGTYTGQCIPGK